MNAFDYNTAVLLFSVMVSFRLGAFFMSSPIASYVITPYVIVLLSLAMGFLLAPSLRHQVPVGFGNDGGLFFYAILSEILIGVMMGFALQVVFVIGNVAGEFSGLQIGFSMASLFDPNLGQVPLLAFYYRIFLMVVFFMLDLHHDLILILARTYETLPVGLPFFSFSEFVPAIMKLFNQIFLLGLKLSFPIVMVILLFNVTVGIITLTAPQMNFYFNISFVVNIAIGMSLVALGIITLFRFFESGMDELFQFLNLFFT